MIFIIFFSLANLVTSSKKKSSFRYSLKKFTLLHCDKKEIFL